MSLTPKPIDGGTVTVAAVGTSVAAPPIPDNCHTIIVSTPNALASVYLALSTPGLPVTLATADAVSFPFMHLSIPILRLKRRAGFDMNTPPNQLVVDANFGGVPVHFAYICGASGA